MLLQARNVDENPTSADILKILYASEDEKVSIDNDGKLSITPADGSSAPVDSNPETDETMV
eukprot:CAMPEP_0116876168 /NCGR_PEP_ID=MMETSP0463-20121206/8179_1 /TAXON_ID=181622 /ORGANISM="Strombidinopsis sp, Strain SopsisLIS2011" /LENGTH=60 /DNA_ID=CAMNT_0004522641 /DNA_START=705 /DNA_END=887 /DNA_ORIENTATION=+